MSKDPTSPPSADGPTTRSSSPTSAADPQAPRGSRIDLHPAEPMLAVEDVAKVLQVSKCTVWRLLERGQLPPPDLSDGRKFRRWHRGWLLAWLAGR